MAMAVWTEDRPGVRHVKLVDALLHDDDSGYFVIRGIEQTVWGNFWIYLGSSLNIEATYGDELTPSETAEHFPS